MRMLLRVEVQDSSSCRGSIPRIALTAKLSYVMYTRDIQSAGATTSVRALMIGVM